VAVVQRGCLLLADLSGYTRYLTGVELEHSHDVLADLLGVVAPARIGGEGALGEARTTAGSAAATAQSPG
jgi:hypothetical protein